MEQVQFDILIAKSLSDTLTSSEKSELDGYLASSPLAKQHFEKCCNVWTKANALSRFAKIDKCKNDDFCKVLARTQVAKGKVVQLSLQSSFRKWFAAASVLVVVALSGWYLHQNVAGFGRWEAVTADAQITSIQLPDHSTVTLNKGSRLVFLKNMDGVQRSVRLRGEAFFDVEKDPSRVFVVSTTQGDVRVLGTAFNVRTDKKEKLLEVFVERGKVAIGDGHQQLVLNNKEIGRLQNGKLSKSAVGTPNVLYWKDGQIVLDNNTLLEVVDILKTNFPEIEAVDIKCIDDKTRITTRFDNQTLSDIFTELQVHFNVSFELIDGVLTVK